MAASPGLHQSSGYPAAHLSVLSNPWPCEAALTGRQSGIGAGALPRFNLVVLTNRNSAKKLLEKACNFTSSIARKSRQLADAAIG